jgi:hypothetical protein
LPRAAAAGPLSLETDHPLAAALPRSTGTKHVTEIEIPVERGSVPALLERTSARVDEVGRFRQRWRFWLLRLKDALTTGTAARQIRLTASGRQPPSEYVHHLIRGAAAPLFPSRASIAGCLICLSTAFLRPSSRRPVNDLDAFMARSADARQRQTSAIHPRRR